MSAASGPPNPGLPDDGLSAADAALLGELVDALSAESDPPPHVLRAARASYTWRTVDAELALLTFDSLLDHEPARSRSSGTGTRTLTFESAAAAIEVEVDAVRGRRRVVGQLVPPQVAEVELTVGDEVVRAAADGLGRFVLPLPAGAHPVQLLVRLGDGTEIVARGVAL